MMTAFPSITIFLFFGILCGPFILGALLPHELHELKWINQVALGYIGLTAGGKLHVEDVKANLSATLWITFFSVAVPYCLTLCLAMVVGKYFIAFMAPLEFSTMLAVSLLFASIAIARSPSSAIAIIEELHAKGPFTTIVLTATVLVDVVVVLLFAVTQLLVNGIAPLAGATALPPTLVLLRFAGQTIISVVFGIVLGKFFALFIFLMKCGQETNFDAKHRSPVVRSVGTVCQTVFHVFIRIFERVSFLLSGWALFLEEEADIEADRWTWQNPLIVCMVTGFVIVNYTHAGAGFKEIMHDVAGPVLLIFFVYTGLTMDLMSLQRNWLACVLLFAARTGGIYLGSGVGGKVGGQPKEFYEKYWMSFLTQAGVSLGLAMSVPDAYPWKKDFVACCVALMVANQIVGPPLLKHAIKAVNEDNTGYIPKAIESPVPGVALANLGTKQGGQQSLPQPRGALVIGDDEHNVGHLLVRRLRHLEWEVCMLDEELEPLESEAPTQTSRMSVIRQRQSMFQMNRLPQDVINKMKALAAKNQKAAQQAPPPPPEAPPTDKSENKTVGFFHQLRAGTERSSFFRLPGIDNNGRSSVVEEVTRVVEFASQPVCPPLVVPAESSVSTREDGSTLGLRLVKAAVGMKNIDVIIVLLPNDQDCYEMCELISGALPLIQNVRRLSDLQMPQVVVALEDPTALNDVVLAKPPLIINKSNVFLPLLTEILHPTAHWTGSLDDDGIPGSDEKKSESKADGKEARALL